MNRILNLQTLLLIFFASVTSGLTFYFYHEKTTLKFPKFLPTSYGNEIEVKRYDQDGLLKSQLYAPYVENDANSNVTVFFKPKLWIYQKGAEPWVMTADQATANKDYSTIILNNHVLMQQAATPTTNGMQLQTSILTIKPNEQLAYTDQALLYKQFNMQKISTTIHAIGLNADQKIGKIELLHQIHIIYHPEAEKSDTNTKFHF